MWPIFKCISSLLTDLLPCVQSLIVFLHDERVKLRVKLNFQGEMSLKIKQLMETIPLSPPTQSTPPLPTPPPESKRSSAELSMGMGLALASSHLTPLPTVPLHPPPNVPSGKAVSHARLLCPSRPLTQVACCAHAHTEWASLGRGAPEALPPPTPPCPRPTGSDGDPGLGG